MSFCESGVFVIELLRLNLFVQDCNEEVQGQGKGKGNGKGKTKNKMRQSVRARKLSIEELSDENPVREPTLKLLSNGSESDGMSAFCIQVRNVGMFDY